MGVLFDYFRAPNADVAAVVDEPGWAGPFCPADDRLEPFDAVDAKWVDPAVCLGQLVAFVQEVPWRAGLMIQVVVRPAPDDEAPFPEHGLDELRDGARDVLAGITAEQIPGLCARWAAIEEFGGHHNEQDLAVLVAELAELAVRARAAGDHLYCWWSL